MDSVTQAVLGAAVAAVCVEKQHRRKAVLIGAVLGTIPDLDVFIDYGDAVSNFTYHRGFSHSLFVLAPFAFIVWAGLRQRFQTIRSSPKRWLLAISLVLITHTLLDAHTAYGTQLFWPLTTPPVMWSTIFIIDPAYTIILLVGVFVVLITPHKGWSSKTLALTMMLSCSYLGWTWVAKWHVETRTLATIKQDNPNTKIFTAPTPFNSLLWRIVVLQGDNYAEGYYSFLSPNREIAFATFPRLQIGNTNTESFDSVKRLYWFSQGFVKESIIDNYLVLSDLRMGFEGHYAFNHAVAKLGNPHFYEIDSRRLPSGRNFKDLKEVWKKF